MHWTYEDFEGESDLEQGDFLTPTEELRKVLREVHPHFTAEKYLGFSVATQSCDLVRRGGRLSKARHVSIAVVRSLRQVLPRLLGEVVKPLGKNGVFRESSKLDAKRFLERLFDQNEQALGLFYLHQESRLGLGEPAVVFLRVTVALKADHYGTLSSARKGRLTPEFRAKFGWLLGNLYSRVANPDWADHKEDGKREVKALIDNSLREELPGNGPLWLDDNLVDAGLAANVQFDGRAHADLIAELEEHKPPPLAEQLTDAALHEVAKLLPAVTEEEKRKLRARLLNNAQFRKALRGRARG